MPSPFLPTQVLAGPHKGQTLRLEAGGAEVPVGRNAPRKNGLRLDKDFEVSDKCVRRPSAVLVFLAPCFVCYFCRVSSLKAEAALPEGCLKRQHGTVEKVCFIRYCTVRVSASQVHHRILFFFLRPCL